MKTKTILVAVVALASVVTTTPEANAAKITMLNDTTAMIMFDVRFTATVGDHLIPVLASSTVGYLDRADVVGYQLDGAAVSTVNGIMLSTQPLDGTKYMLEKDTEAQFKLFILATLEEPLTTDLTVTITKIPYWVDGKRTTVHQNQLDELETATLSK